MVGGDHGDAAHFHGGVHHTAHALIHGLHGLHRRVKDTGVTHHVAVGEVQDDDIIRTGFDPLHALVAHLVGAHLRLEIVGRHLGRGHQHPVLAGELGLHAAVEEEGHMGILLRFRDAELGQSQIAEILTQTVADGLTGVGHLHIGHGSVILRGADEGHGEILAGEAVELRVHKGPGDLTGPVRAVVEEDHTVIIGDGAVPVADHRLDELVGDAGGVGILHRCHGQGIDVGALTVDHGVIGGFHTVPALVAVHGVVTAHEGCDLTHAQLPALFHRPGHIVHAGGGGNVPSIQKCVDVDPLKATVLCHLHQGEEVVDVGVDAAVAEQTHEVKGRALFLAGVHGVNIGGILEEISVINGFADPGQVLKHHPACADVGVAHLTVAHLACRQTYIQTGGGQLCMGILLEELIQTRSVGGGNGVALRLGPETESVHNDECGRCFVHRNLISHKGGDCVPPLFRIIPDWPR